MYTPGAAPSVHVGPGRAGTAEVIVTNYERLELRGAVFDALLWFCPGADGPSWSSTRPTG